MGQLFNTQISYLKTFSTEKSLDKTTAFFQEQRGTIAIKQTLLQNSGSLRAVHPGDKCI